MRRWLAAVTLGGMALTVLTGCAHPGGLDGDLTDDWPALGEAKQFAPEAGACHPAREDIGYLNAYHPVDCGQPHRVETLHIGAFTGEDARRVTPPPAGSPSMRAAWKECETKTNEQLGGDVHGARLTLFVVPPSRSGWTGGARWFRCDVTEITSLDDNTPVPRTRSLKGALRTPSDLTYGCFRPKLVNGAIDTMSSVPCTATHRSEFAGVFTAPDTTYAAFDGDGSRTHRQCRSVIASFAKVPDNGQLAYRTGTILYPPSEDEWAAGNRVVRCFLWISNRDLTRSLRGTGTKGLPIN